ncbi:MAG: hypothetical protein QOD65_1986 [Gaiellales bacterium]|nr:hypothetical protein [Gaiellales bacterium]
MSTEPDALRQLYTYARALEPTSAEIQQTLARCQRATSRTPGRRHAAVLAVIVMAVAVLVAALVANPFSRSGTVSAAEAKAQAAAALDFQGGWHITRVTTTGEVQPGKAPVFSGAVTEDAWHAPDGRMRVQSTIAGAGFGVCCSLILYAGGERQIYMADRKSTYVHRFALAADLRDDERAFLPPSAADLYRAAYRDGRVRLAGITRVQGRDIYRLEFDWLGSSYTLSYDSSRRVPISSEARTPMSRFRLPAQTAGARGSFVSRVRYTTYEQVDPGPLLNRHLTLPAGARTAKQLSDAPIFVPRPVQGASAARLARAVAHHMPGILPATAHLADASYAIVRQLAHGGMAAVALIPNHGGKVSVSMLGLGGRTTLGNCISIAEIPHLGGEAVTTSTSCNGTSLGFWNHDRTNALVGGTTTARRVDIRLHDGTTVRATLRRGVYFAILPAAKARYPFSILTTARDGSIKRQLGAIWTPLPQPLPGE